MSGVDVSSTLNEALERLAGERKARAIAVALHDVESGLRFSLHGDRWFHAASTIKVAVLVAVFRAADEGRLRMDDSLHVRNRFISVADGSPFHLSRDSDAMPELYKRIGRVAKISELAEGMIECNVKAKIDNKVILWNQLLSMRSTSVDVARLFQIPFDVPTSFMKVVRDYDLIKTESAS